MKYSILVIDDDSNFLRTVEKALNNCNITTVSSPAHVVSKLEDSLDLVLLDLVFDRNDPDRLQGLSLIPQIQQNLPNVPIVVMTNFPSKVKIGPQIFDQGVKDFFLKKECDWIEWKNRIENYCKDYREKKLLLQKTRELESREERVEIIGVSREIEFVRLKLKDLAENSSDISIFIYGETGTGKNLAVKYFRQYSARKDKPFQEFSIVEKSESVLESELFGHKKGAFTGAQTDKKGLFEAADGGILFLDEIGDYDPKIQIKIMRFLEDKSITPVGSTESKKIDVQLIMATNRNIPQMVTDGTFREDLYMRINQAKIELPPLRQRKQDIKILADHFFQSFRLKEKTNLQKISKKVYMIFDQYQWPGNVRELQFVIWEACTNARLYNDSILLEKHLRKDLSQQDAPTHSKDLNESLEAKKEALELEQIDAALQQTHGRKEEAAKILKKNSDNIRYRVVECYKKFPQLVQQFPYILKYYQKQFDKTL